MTEYLYLPVQDPSLVEIVLDINRERQSASDKIKQAHPNLVGDRYPQIEVISFDDKGSYRALRHFLFGKALRDLAPTDTLYLVSHGSMQAVLKSANGAIKTVEDGNAIWFVPGAEKVGGDRRDHTKKHYEPKDLARHLRAEGLPKTFVDLHLFCCQAGLGNQLGWTFGDRFKGEMRALGYGAIKVTAYLGNVKGSFAEAIPRFNKRDEKISSSNGFLKGSDGVPLYDFVIELVGGPCHGMNTSAGNAKVEFV
jgi:hypothetical protein